MKYIVDLIKISLFVLLLYIPPLWFSTQKTFQKSYDILIKDRIQRLTNTKDVATQLMTANQIVELCMRLESERSANNVQFYSVKSSEGECEYLKNIQIDPQTITAKQFSEFRSEEFALLVYGDRDEKTQWFVAIDSPQYMGLFEKIKKYEEIREAFIHELILVIYIIFAFMFFAVVLLAKSIQNQYRKQGKDPFWLKVINSLFGFFQLHDIRILQSATSTLIQQKDSLLKDKDLLETSLEYSILNEVRQNNHNIPYTFKGTAARVDINGFSKVVSSGHSYISHNLTHFLEEYGCELLQRYGGLFEKTVGDEIIVVFKTKDSAKLALAFARDLMFEFSQLEFDFQTEKRFFTLKGSISSSDLTFSKRAPGYGFHGDALTYTARLLDVVNIKDRNILSCMSDEVGEIKELVSLPSEVKKFEFKNMPSTNGYLIDQFLPLKAAYYEKPHLLPYYRANGHIVELFEYIQAETDFKRIDLVFECFRLFQVRQCNEDLIQAWKKTIRIFESKAKSDKEYIATFSKIIMESSALIPKSQWTLECTEILLSISRGLDGRINASIIDVFIGKDLYHIAIENEFSFIIDSDRSYRTRGNLLLSQAYHKLDNKIFSKVIEMIKSENSLEMNTGIYCACNILIYYKKHNPAELEIYDGYSKLLKTLKNIQNNESALSPRLKGFLEKAI